MTTRARAAGLLTAVCLTFAGVDSAPAALAPGEYACVGSGGRILIGLGFRLIADGTYTDLDGKSRGRVTYSADGSTITFVGGHLDGQTGHNARNGGSSFQIKAISCSRD